MDRESYLDYGRIIAVFLVVLGHLYNGHNVIPRQYIYAFHMPFFFLVSGMLHKYNGGVQWKKYLKTLLMPFFLFNLVYVLCLSITHYTIGIFSNIEDYNLKDYLFLLFKKNSFIFNDVTWFLLALFYCKIMIDYGAKYPKVMFAVWLSLFFLLVLNPHLKVFCIPQALMALPFYFIGYSQKKIIRVLTHNRYALFWGAISLFATILLTHWHGRVTINGVRFCYNDSPLFIAVPIFYLNGIIGSIMILFFSSWFKPKKWVEDIAGSLITILCVQRFFLVIFISLLGINKELYITVPVALIIVILCYYTHIFIRNKCPLLIGKC